MDVRVSIIIPVKNAAADLARLLDSIARLDYDPERLEVIVCDNGSEDETAEVARSRGCTLLSLPALSIAGLRNRGAEVARGDVLAFVDADCEVERGWIRAALPHLRAPDVGAVGSYPLPPPDATWVQELWTLKERIKAPIHDAQWLPSMNFIVRRSVFLALGGFSVALRTCEDVDLSYRMRRDGRRIVWDQAVGVIHHGEPATLRILYQKERWHGRDNYRGLLHHGLRKEEIPSLVLPAAVLAAHILPFTALAGSLLSSRARRAFLVTSPLLALTPSVAAVAAGRIAWRAGRPRAFIRLGLIYWVYLIARASALLPRDPIRPFMP